MSMAGLEKLRPTRTPVDVCAQAKCEYCGRHGAIGQCTGCGAPNVPVRVNEAVPSGVIVSDGQPIDNAMVKIICTRFRRFRR